ncbi:nucleotide pyrophosphohydrolase [Promicromonospora alba]|uniref:Nucleotide pyrophosphohydrolase n=1 Tax=Promicromonospora alba TaxID=1616110 RepID=A0ABV9HPX2_9MICO
MDPTEHNLESISKRARAFAAERDWDQFHSPKNLAMALAGEVGELVAEMQWLSNEEILEATLQRTRPGERIAHEMADVLLYLVRLADVCDIDLVSVAHAKIDLNAQKYPVELARGSARKYTELGPDH